MNKKRFLMGLKLWEVGVVVLLGQIVGLLTFFLQVLIRGLYWDWQEVLTLVMLVIPVIAVVYPASFVLRLLDRIRQTRAQHKRELGEWIKVCSLSCLRMRAQGGLILTTRRARRRSRGTFLILGVFLGIIGLLMAMNLGYA